MSVKWTAWNHRWITWTPLHVKTPLIARWQLMNHLHRYQPSDHQTYIDINHTPSDLHRYQNHWTYTGINQNHQTYIDINHRPADLHRYQSNHLTYIDISLYTMACPKQQHRLYQSLIQFHTHAHTCTHARTHTHTHTHTHNCFMALLDFVWDYPGEPAPDRQNQDLLEQETVSGSGISWASIPPLSFYRLDALPATQPTTSKHWKHSTIRIFTTNGLFFQDNLGKSTLQK